MQIAVIYLIIVNIIAFSAFGIDKCRAKKGKWRISERQLLAFAALGGTPGAFLGMRLFHHKTKKPKFYVGVPVIFVLQAALAVGIYLVTR